MWLTTKIRDCVWLNQKLPVMRTWHRGNRRYDDFHSRFRPVICSATPSNDCWPRGIRLCWGQSSFVYEWSRRIVTWLALVAPGIFVYPEGVDLFPCCTVRRLSVCVGWCTDWVRGRITRINIKLLLTGILVGNFMRMAADSSSVRTETIRKHNGFEYWTKLTDGQTWINKIEFKFLNYTFLLIWSSLSELQSEPIYTCKREICDKIFIIRARRVKSLIQTNVFANTTRPTTKYIPLAATTK